MCSNNSQTPFYKQLEFLGKGGFAEVYKVVYKNRLYALKKIPLYRLKNPHDKERINQEIEIMKRISHTRIVHLYDVFQNENQLCLVLQYVPGGSLFQKLKDCERLPEYKVKRYVKDVIQAIQYLHKQKHPILHRDLKPENILLDKEGRCKLADFGSSNIMVEGTVRQTYTGTDEYRAPEAYRGEAQDVSVDIWSLGVLIYQLLVGRVPQGRQSIEQDTNNQLWFPDFISRSAQNLIKKILNKNPLQRISLDDLKEHIWICDVISQAQYQSIIARKLQLGESQYTIPSSYRKSQIINGKTMEEVKQKKQELYDRFYQKHLYGKKTQEIETLSPKKTNQNERDQQIKKRVEQHINILNEKAKIKLQIQINKLKINRKLKEKEKENQLLTNEQERWIQKIKQYQSNIQILKKSPLKFRYVLLETFQRLNKEIKRLEQHVKSLPENTERVVTTFPSAQSLQVNIPFLPEGEYIHKLIIQFLQIRKSALIELRTVRKVYCEIQQLSMMEQKMRQKRESGID